VFEGLVGADRGAIVAGVAIRDEFDPAFIVEEEEAVALGQGFAGLDELDELAPFGVGEFVAVGGRRAGHGRNRKRRGETEMIRGLTFKGRKRDVSVFWAEKRETNAFTRELGDF